MTTSELIAALARECPNGVSFDPMAVRLLRQKIPVEDCQIEEMKIEMFQLENGLWFSREMILNDESQIAFEEQAMEWLLEYGCFSVEQLFRDFYGILKHISKPEYCMAFLRHLGFTVAEWGKGCYFCFQPPPNLNDCLAAISETIAGLIEEAGGMFTFHELKQTMPHLTVEALESIRVHFLQDVHAIEVGGVPCWCNTESIMLPEDFSEKLTAVVDTLVALEEKITAKKLEFALNLSYRTRLREKYALLDNTTFMSVCGKHYKGANYIFPNNANSRARANGKSASCKRVRSANTRFNMLGVPIGSKLVFTKDSHIICTVRNDSNQVEYGGKIWAISALAMHLLGGVVANGFALFSYDGETLLERRLRLERETEPEELKEAEMLSRTEEQQADGGIIGLDGRTLSTSTWQVFRYAGTNSRVAEWARRVANGESAESIARKNGVKATTVKQYISNRRCYLSICKRNGIVPEDGTNV